MALALLSAAALFGAAANAVNFVQPRATDVPEIPSDAQSPIPTAGPRVKELLRRQAAATTAYLAPDNTCGFLSGSLISAYTCNAADDQCAILTLPGTQGYIGCCDTTTCGGFHLTCIDRVEYSSSSLCDSSCQSDSLTLKCTGTAAPYCNAVSINGGASLKVYGFFCNDEITTTVQGLLTTYNGETDGRSFSPFVYAGGTSAGSVVDVTETFGSSSTSTTTTNTNTNTHTSTSSSSTNTGTGTPPPSHSTNAGAIAGGTVGGVAAVGIIALAAFFLYRRHQRNQVQQQGPVAGPGGAGAGAGAPGGGPGGAGGAAGAAALGGAAAGAGMAQIHNTPSPVPGAYYTPDPTKTPEYNVQQQQAQYGNVSPPVNQQQAYFPNQQYPQQQQYAQQPYYAGPGAQPAPDRAMDSASPASQDYNRISSISAAGSQSPYLTGPISPQTTGASGVAGGGVAPGQPQVPPTIHEAGGNAVGGGQPDYNATHHGEMHELA